MIIQSKEVGGSGHLKDKKYYDVDGFFLASLKKTDRKRNESDGKKRILQSVGVHQK